MYKKYICAFADTRLKSSVLRRFKSQAEAMKVYDRIFIYTEHDLASDFYRYWLSKFKLQRGFGYWVWKPQIILQSLEQINEGDILQYTDVGCHLNPGGIARLNEYFEMANHSKVGILGFQYRDAEDPSITKLDDWLERRYTKGDLFDYFGIRERADMYDTPQYWGGRHVY